MAQKRPHSPPPASIYSSSPIHDRSSTFKAVYSPTLSARSLQSLSSLATASHRIAAWRVPSKQSTLDAKLHARAGSINNVTLHDAGHDSDGERGAGRRLEKLLMDEGVEGALVVGRWYGGVMLGPIRFSHIESVAKAAIRNARADGSNAAALKRARIASPRVGTATKKPIDLEAAAKQKLDIMEVLKERDANIIVLRQLLEDKKAKLEGRASSSVTPSKSLIYARMPLPAIKALEKVRDATVAYLLKELDKVDEAQREEDALNAAFLQVEESSEQKRKTVNEEEEDQRAWDVLAEAKDQT
jgi:Uncharacterized protein family UPF0029